MRQGLERHDAIVRGAIDACGGYVFSAGGDGFAAAFARAGEAVAAAIEAQRALGAEGWPEGAPLRVRIGLHTGEAAEGEGDYFGTAVNHAARLMAVGHGGRVWTDSVRFGTGHDRDHPKWSEHRHLLVRVDDDRHAHDYSVRHELRVRYTGGDDHDGPSRTGHGACHRKHRQPLGILWTAQCELTPAT
jgi:hypothetical protein